MKTLISIAIISLLIIISIVIYAEKTGDHNTLFLAYLFGIIFLMDLFAILTEIANKDN
jgi:hypothetical protein